MYRLSNSSELTVLLVKMNIFLHANRYELYRYIQVMCDTSEGGGGGFKSVSVVGCLMISFVKEPQAKDTDIPNKKFYETGV